MDSKQIIGNNLKLIREFKNISAAQLSNMAKIPKSSISDWEHGKSTPSAESVFKICQALNINPSSLIYNSSLMHKPFNPLLIDNNGFNSSLVNTIPVLGSIPAGIPIEAIQSEDAEQIYITTPPNGEYFALKVKGDSMSPTINDGDTAIIRKQEDANSGQICVVMINGYDATLKQIKKDPNGIWILPYNPNSDFKPTFYTNKEIEELPVKIIGVAVEIRRSL